MSDADPTAATVAATLRTIAGWFDAEQRQQLRDVAEDVELDPLGACCPLCQEVTCDEGCPLQSVREAATPPP